MSRQDQLLKLTNVGTLRAVILTFLAGDGGRLVGDRQGRGSRGLGSVALSLLLSCRLRLDLNGRVLDSGSRHRKG